MFVVYAFISICDKLQSIMSNGQSRGQQFHSSAGNYEGYLKRTSNSSQSTRPVGRMLWEELLVLFRITGKVLWEELREEVILHITLLCSL